MKAASGNLEKDAGGSGVFVDQRVELMKRHWRNLPSNVPSSGKPKKSGPAITIAISRQRGSLGALVGVEVGKKLDWPVYDRKLVDLVAERAVLRAELLESIDEHDRPWLLEVLTGLGSPGEISSAGYLHHLKHVMAALASHGNCIIVGRGATAFLPPKTTLRVRIHAPLQLRAERVAEEKRISLDVAKSYIDEIDRGRTNFVVQHFETDVTRAELFDIVLSTQRISVDACAEMIAAAARSMQVGLEKEA